MPESLGHWSLWKPHAVFCHIFVGPRAAMCSLSFAWEVVEALGTPQKEDEVSG